MLKTCGWGTKKETPESVPFLGWFVNRRLEGVAQANEETVGLQIDVVTRVEVEEAQTIAAKQVELAELHISAEHGIKIEAAQFAVVTIPVVIESAAANSGLGVTSDSKAQHGADKRNNFQVAVEVDAIVEQNRHIDKGLCALTGSETKEGVTCFRIHAELGTCCHANAF